MAIYHRAGPFCEECVSDADFVVAANSGPVRKLCAAHGDLWFREHAIDRVDEVTTFRRVDCSDRQAWLDEQNCEDRG